MAKLKVFLLSLLMFIPGQAFAGFNGEYYTYGGFEPVTLALSKISLILSDSGYQGLFAVMAVGGIMAAGIGVMTRLKAGQAEWSGLFLPVIIGFLIFFGFCVKKGDLTVYDPTINRFETISNIPEGLVMLAHSLSLIERGLIEIVDTTSITGETYEEAAGGKGFTAVEAFVNGTISNLNTSIDRSTEAYVEDCVTFEVNRPGGTDIIEKLSNAAVGTEILDILADAENPSVYTMWYDAGTGSAGVARDCKTAYASIKTWWNNPVNLQTAINQACGHALFDTANAMEMQHCRTLAENAFATSTNSAGMDSNSMYRQAQLSKIIFKAMTESDEGLAAVMTGNQQAASSMFGMGQMANEWVPLMRGVVTGVAFALVPFILLFIPTPIFGRGLSLIVGLFVWLTAWGITDAICHNFAIDFAARVFADADNNAGMSTMLSFPTRTGKLVAIFGFVRSSGAMLATIITTNLFKFAGSHAMAMFANQMQAPVQQAGGVAGQTLTPTGAASKAKSLVSATTSSAMFSSAAFNIDDYSQNAMKSDLHNNAKGSAFTDASDAINTGAHAGKVTAGGYRGAMKQLDALGLDAGTEAGRTSAQGVARQVTKNDAWDKTGGAPANMQGLTNEEIIKNAETQSANEGVSEADADKTGRKTGLLKNSEREAIRDVLNKDMTAAGRASAGKIATAAAEQKALEGRAREALGPEATDKQIQAYVGNERQKTANLKTRSDVSGTAGKRKQLEGEVRKELATQMKIPESQVPQAAVNAGVDKKMELAAQSTTTGDIAKANKMGDDPNAVQAAATAKVEKDIDNTLGDQAALEDRARNILPPGATDKEVASKVSQLRQQVAGNQATKGLATAAMDAKKAEFAGRNLYDHMAAGQVGTGKHEAGEEEAKRLKEAFKDAPHKPEVEAGDIVEYTVGLDDNGDAVTTLSLTKAGSTESKSYNTRSLKSLTTSETSSPKGHEKTVYDAEGKPVSQTLDNTSKSTTMGLDEENHYVMRTTSGGWDNEGNWQAVTNMDEAGKQSTYYQDNMVVHLGARISGSAISDNAGYIANIIAKGAGTALEDMGLAQPGTGDDWGKRMDRGVSFYTAGTLNMASEIGGIAGLGDAAARRSQVPGKK